MKLIRRDEVIAGFYVLLAVILLVIGGCVLQTIDANGQDIQSITETWCATEEPTKSATYPGEQTLTPTWVRTLTLTPPICWTCTPTKTSTSTITATATVTRTPTPTKTKEPSLTPTKTPTNTPTDTPTGTLTPTDTPTITATATVTETQSPSSTPTPTLTGTQPSPTLTGTQPIVTDTPQTTTTETDKLPQTGAFEDLMKLMMLAGGCIVALIFVWIMKGRVA